MTSNDLLQRIDFAKALWNVAIPMAVRTSVTIEDDIYFAWVGEYTDDEIAHALRRCGSKLRSGGVKPEEVGKYISGVLRSARRDGGNKVGTVAGNTAV
jgi:hypothetical protein